MSLQLLTEIAPPPQHPIDAGSIDGWPDVERQIGTRLPCDYKELINTYGSGCFGGYIYPLNPFAIGQYAIWRELISSVGEILRIYRESQTSSPEDHAPFHAYPFPGGLLPWATDENAGVLFWKTFGPEDIWPIVYLDDDYSELTFEYDTNSTGLLHSLLVEQLLMPTFVRPGSLQVSLKFVTYDRSIHH